MSLEIKTVKDIYISLELELIRADEVPDLVIEHLFHNPENYNDKHLIELASSHKPQLFEIEKLFFEKLGIDKISPYEKLLIVINQYEKGSISTAKTYDLISHFTFNYTITLKSYDNFLSDFYNYIILKRPVYSGDWDEDFLEIKSECKSKIDVYNYSEYLS